MSSELQDFRQVYTQYVTDVLEPTRRTVQGVFDDWREPEFWANYKRYEENALPAPTQRTKLRVKRIESVLDKFRRMPDEFPGQPDGDNLRRMRDALGARTIVFFPSQLAMMDTEIRSGRHFEISDEKGPKSYIPRHMMEAIGLNPDVFRGDAKKPSGYSSLHYTVRLVKPAVDENPWFELQTRTMLEEVWGEVEHQIGYKPDQHTDFAVKRQFRVISDHLTALDSHFDFLSNELLFLQANAGPEEGDLLNAENLPAVLRRLECLVLQREINGLLRVLGDYEITTVGALLRLGHQELIEAIQAEYRRLKGGRAPTAFDIVPVLIQMDSRSTADDARRILRVHIDIADQVRQQRRRRAG